MTFGAWLKKTRKYHGMTLDELAAKARISKSSLWEIEKGKVPLLSTAEKISIALGCELWRALRNAQKGQDHG